ncbi:MAG: excinuclease ABC subunit UvrC [Victivallaceae bacterium]|nr:excinuclease ABC subunit UvrC [Victivallaceae bacterium]
MRSAAEFHPSEIPAKPGVYIYRDRFDRVIYVGKASNLRRRMSSYFQLSRRNAADPKLRSLIHSIASWSFEVVHSEAEALLLEARLIKTYAPHYNILMRDDKRYLLLKIDWSEDFPTLALARVKKPGNFQYFGPFPNGSALRSTLEFLLRHFGLRACRDSHPNEETRRHCLKRTIKDCCAPCIGNVTQEEYKARLDEALKVLNGDITPLQEKLREEMTEASLNTRFEAAARLRDISANLEAVFGRKSRIFARPELPEITPGKAAVESLAKHLGIEKIKGPIIGFDISNILGTLAVASLVCFTDGRPDRDHYRRFRIKTVHQSDDFAMMHEAITRHFSRLLEEKRPLPGVLLVDGGKGQLSAALDALVEIHCPPFPILGLAKRNEEIFLPGRSEPVIIDRHDPAIRLLQALRDEAHRFAITYHRELRRKAIEHSVIEEVPGIGKKRKMEILRAFGSLRALKKASAGEIAQKVRGIGEETAQKLLDHIRQK